MKATPWISARASALGLGVLLVGVPLLAGSSLASIPPTDQTSVRLPITTEPPTMNSMMARDTLSRMVLGHVMEGLTRDGNGAVAPGVAESWEARETRVVFHLRKTSRWSDGSPVTARDFLNGWQTTLDPKTASPEAEFLYRIKNGEAIHKGRLPTSSLGASAPDDYTIKVELERPCPYFISLTSHRAYYPLKREFYEAQGAHYASDADRLLYNGPFTLSKWVHSASLELRKNPRYWNASAVHLQTIQVPFITPDVSAHLNFFRSHLVDYVLGIDGDTIRQAAATHVPLKTVPAASIRYIQFNVRPGRVTANLNFRKAIQAAINRKEYVDRILSVPGSRPSWRLTFSWMKVGNELIQSRYPVSEPESGPEIARAYLKKAMEELGLKSIPPLAWLTVDSPSMKKVGEYFQNVLKRTLGIELKLDQQTFKQMIARMDSGDFDLFTVGRVAGFDDPVSVMEVFETHDPNNWGHYSDPGFDQAYQAVLKTSEPKARAAALARLEKAALDTLPIIPLSEESWVYLSDDHLKGVVRRTVGLDPDFTYAHW